MKAFTHRDWIFNWNFFFMVLSGVDAHIALEFHEARGNLKLLLGENSIIDSIFITLSFHRHHLRRRCRVRRTEAHPEKFNSRLRNKMFYGQAGKLFFIMER